MIYPLLLTSILPAHSNFALLDITLNEPMYSHFTAIYNNSIMTIAGKDRDDYARSMHSMISIPLIPNTWTEYSATLPIDIAQLKIEGQCAVQIDDSVYIMNPSTRTPNTPSKPCAFRYSLTTNTYAELSKPDIYDVGSCAVYHPTNNIIYVMAADITHRYNIANNEWITDAANIDVYRYYGGCSLDPTNNHIYYFGGDDHDEYITDTIYKYNIINNEWIKLSSTLNTARSALKCLLLSSNGNIYCIGGVTYTGVNENWSVSNKVEVFDPNTETVITEMKINTARELFAAKLMNDDTCIIISGGVDIDDIVLDSIEYFGDCSDYLLRSMLISATDTVTSATPVFTEESITINTLSDTDDSITPLSSVNSAANDMYSTINQIADDTTNNTMLLGSLISILICCLCICFGGILYKTRNKDSLMMIKSVSANERNIASDSDNEDIVITEVEIWLRDVVKLPVYRDIFIKNGYRTMDCVKRIKDKAILGEIGVTKLEHQTRIMYEIKKIEQAHCSDIVMKKAEEQYREVDEGDTLGLDIDNPNIGEGDIVL